ncbi:hypothetical protein FSP39_011474 [Pinctada imbricata]|uniref:Peptidase S1 domain-containing protein n=1 Tax=Pinctada imbricata TaxID=66713 RepID=A0AA88XLW5_PINIB|nr:hypothetical protein FSP39_011474 [Pinctada imbricata]
MLEVNGLTIDNGQTGMRIAHFEPSAQHKEYPTPDGFGNDIAIIRLSEEVNHVNAEKINLPTENDIFMGKDCWISGWGKISGSNNDLPDALMKAKINVISNDDCASRWSSVQGATVLDTNICLLNDGDKQSACNGDSGGPLVCKVNDVFVLAGVTSWGVSTCEGSPYPSVYVRVQKYLDWIKNPNE